MDQQLPKVLLFPGWCPDPQEAIFHQQLQQQACIPLVVLCCRESLARIFAASPIYTACPSLLSSSRNH
jgi:hypothetical protein